MIAATTAAPQSAVGAAGSRDKRAVHAFHFAVALTGVVFGFTAPLTAVVATEVGAGPFIAGIAVSSMSLTIILVDVFGTRWTPRLDPMPAMVAGLVIFGAGSLATAATTSLAVIIGARMLQGLGVALFLGVGPQMAVRLAGPGGAGRALGAFNAAWFTGIAAGPLLGGGLAGLLPGVDGLRLAFLVCGVLGLVCAAAMPVVMPRWPSQRRPVWGWPRLAGITSPRQVAVLASGLAGQSIRSGVAMTLVPLIGGIVLELPWLLLGVALSALAITDVLAMVLAPRLTTLIGRRTPLMLACVWGAVITLGLHGVETGATFVAACAALGFSVGATWVVPNEMAVDVIPDTERALATYRISADIGLAVGGPLYGGLLAVGGHRAALVGAAIQLLLMAVLVAVAGETDPARRLRRGHARRPRRDPVHDRRHLRPVRSPNSGGTMTDSRPTSPPAADTQPAPDVITVMLADQGRDLLGPWREKALETHRAMRPGVERLRALPLPFYPAVDEPAAALSWIERGGKAS